MSAAGEGAAEGELVGGFEAAAGGEALGDAGDGELFAAEDIGEVIGGGFAFDVGAEGEDDFARGLGVDAGEELGDAELIGADVIEWGEAAAEGVVAAAEDAGALEGKDVGGLLDDAEEGGVAGRIGADFAEGGEAEEGTALAGADGLGGGLDGLGDFDGPGVAGLVHPEGDALGATGADAGHAAQLGDELGDGGGVIGAFQKKLGEGLGDSGGG